MFSLNVGFKDFSALSNISFEWNYSDIDAVAVIANMEYLNGFVS